MKYDINTLHKVYLHRYTTSDQGTYGVLTDDYKLIKYIIELPWRNNEPNISCIPHGRYIAVPHKFKGYRDSFRLLNVPKRSSILIHNGCYAGDKLKGYKTHSVGCLLIGNRIGRIGNQNAVLVSRVGLREFVSYMDNEPFLLTIRELRKISSSKLKEGGEKL